MAVGATRTQKAKVLQLAINGFADQWAWCPRRLHVVVVPGFTPIKPKPSRLFNQRFMAQSISGRVSQNSKPTSLMNRCNNRCRPQLFSHHCISPVVRLQSRMIQLEAEGENMHKAPLQQSTDFHPAPEHRD